MFLFTGGRGIQACGVSERGRVSEKGERENKNTQKSTNTKQDTNTSVACLPSFTQQNRW